MDNATSWKEHNREKLDNATIFVVLYDTKLQMQIHYKDYMRFRDIGHIGAIPEFNISNQI